MDENLAGTVGDRPERLGGYFQDRRIEVLDMRNFVEAMGELGYTYDFEYNQGNRDVIAALQAEKANLLRARDLARTI